MLSTTSKESRDKERQHFFSKFRLPGCTSIIGTATLVQKEYEKMEQVIPCLTSDFFLLNDVFWFSLFKLSWKEEKRRERHEGRRREKRIEKGLNMILFASC